MPGGIYSALSGMMTRLDQLDRIASDLANVSTSGYKTERQATTASERPSFAMTLDAAVDVVSGGSKIDLRSGTIATTGRDLDVAIDGSAFFAVGSPDNPRYTRSGSFTRRADGSLTTAQGEPLLDEQNRPIKLADGPVSIDRDGTVRTGTTVAGRLKLVDFDEKDLIREAGARFRPVQGAVPRPAQATVISGSLEQSNVTAVDRMVALTTVQRGFEGLQRSISVLDDMDQQAITHLTRK